ncbi:hypothetical protein E2562_002719 [Oryza meyeriana var. granulata]|uniref:Uncharacterized protein n=1 Tax=Oryza meyeriana var. granulata TaxID=110450 RepID=A0A6G1BRB6_9ORYZ|nr:hypothetical protein E2562_002719 [Oryza meyeriana var. granulata]
MRRWEEGFDECHLTEITFSTVFACTMCIADQIWPPEAAAGPTGTAAGAASLLGPQAFLGLDLVVRTIAGDGAFDGGEGAGRRGVVTSNGVRSSSSKWQLMREGVGEERRIRRERRRPKRPKRGGERI